MEKIIPINTKLDSLSGRRTGGSFIVPNCPMDTTRVVLDFQNNPVFVAVSWFKGVISFLASKGIPVEIKNSTPQTYDNFVKAHLAVITRNDPIKQKEAITNAVNCLTNYFKNNSDFRNILQNSDSEFELEGIFKARTTDSETVKFHDCNDFAFAELNRSELAAVAVSLLKLTL